MVFHALHSQGHDEGLQCLPRDQVSVYALKIIFDHNYCISSRKYSSKFAKNMALYFVNISLSTFGWRFSLISMFKRQVIYEKD